MLTWYVCTERKRVTGFTATLPDCGNHVATRDIFTAVVVLRVPDSWGEKPSIFFTSLTCCRSLLLRQSRDVAPPVWATRGGDNTGTCVVAVAARALDRVASPRPILASPRERELRKRTRSTPHDTGAAHATAILGAIVVVYISLSTPINSLDIMRFATLSSHERDKTTPPHDQEDQDFDPYDGPGVPPLGLGFGTWFWCFLV